MSVQFEAEGVRTHVLVWEACLCAQNAPGFRADAIKPDLVAAARAHFGQYAAKNCEWCRGSGVEQTRAPKPGLSLSFNMGNGRALLGILGWEGVQGSRRLPDCRRALIRARNIDLARFSRPTETHDEPAFVARHQGQHEIVPRRRFVTFGMDESGLRLRIDQFASLLRNTERLGGTGIAWF
jgi:hypothetical protein